MTLKELFKDAADQAKLVAEHQTKGRELQKLSKANYQAGEDHLAYSRLARKTLIDIVIEILDEAKRQGKPITLTAIVRLLDTNNDGAPVQGRYLYKAIVRERNRRKKEADNE